MAKKVEATNTQKKRKKLRSPHTQKSKTVWPLLNHNHKKKTWQMLKKSKKLNSQKKTVISTSPSSNFSSHKNNLIYVSLENRKAFPERIGSAMPLFRPPRLGIHRTTSTMNNLAFVWHFLRKSPAHNTVTSSFSFPLSFFHISTYLI